MTDQEALAIAWSAVDQEQLHDQIRGLAGLRLATAAEERDVLGIIDPQLRDTWYVSFWLKLEDDVVDQSPNTILIKIDDQSGNAELVYQM